MTKPKPKKKKKGVSYETKIRRLREYRANLSDEQKAKIKEYNRVRSLKARARESPLERERRLQRCRESARRRRSLRKAQAEKELRKLGLHLPSNQIPSSALNPPLQTNLALQAQNKTNSPGAAKNLNINLKNSVKKPIQQNPVKMRNDRVLPAELPLPFINYKPFPIHPRMTQMSMAPMSMNEEYDDMATVCPIECNVDISPEPMQKFKQPLNVMKANNDETFVKNIGAHVVLKKKVPQRSATDDVRLHNGGSSDWNGTASVCPIECNVDITDPSEPPSNHPSTSSNSSSMKRNSLLDTLKQMGTHVILKKKVNEGTRNPPARSTPTMAQMTRILPIDCNVDIKPVQSRTKNSELTIVKHNGSSSVKKLGSEVVMQKVSKPIVQSKGYESPEEGYLQMQKVSKPIVQSKGYESPEEGYEDYDLPCPIECNVDISESS